MPRPRTPLHHHRVPLGITVSPASIALLKQITADLDLPWSRGAIIDRALQIAKSELLYEAAGRELIILLDSDPTRQELVSP